MAGSDTAVANVSFRKWSKVVDTKLHEFDQFATQIEACFKDERYIKILLYAGCKLIIPTPPLSQTVRVF